MDWSFLIKDKDALCVTTDSRKVTSGSVFVALKVEDRRKGYGLELPNKK